MPDRDNTNSITIPALSLVALIGASGSGKSTFARAHFRPTETLSSDEYRAMVGDDPNDQTVTREAFDALHYVAGLRLKLGRLVVVDATNVQQQARASLVHLARAHDVLPVAIVLNLDERVCVGRNRQRADRQLGAHVVRNHVSLLRKSLRGLEREGFRQVHILSTPEAIANVRVERVPLWPDRRGESGPFDIIGDLHGCYDELCDLLGRLGYQDDDAHGMRHPEGRRVIFLGDLVDRGPKVIETARLAMRMVAAEQALCVPGNHDEKLKRYLEGRHVQVRHGLETTAAQLDALPPDERAAFSRDFRQFADGLISHYVLDGGRLVVAHAGMKAEYQGRASSRVREFALYGETTGEMDEFGLPVRADWAADYRGAASVIYGHTPVYEPRWLNNTLNIDTGCVFGGRLTALRWPERELVSVPSRETYARSKRPLLPTAPEETADDTLPRIEDVLGKQIVQTSLLGNVIVEEDRTAAALEVMSRFAADPRWLIYLPPTMSPSETSTRPDLLEHPDEAFAYYRRMRIERAVCEEKHMGSRAVLVLCKDGETAARRFSMPSDGTPGAVYTRTGRPFFAPELERELVERLIRALDATGCWERYATDWICLDAELLPWSAKAQSLLREQYAPVAAAGTAALAVAVESAEAGLARGLPMEGLLERLRARREDIERYGEVYARYCWEVEGLHGLRVAPFHLLATEGTTYFDRDHLWHLAELARLAEVEPLFMPTGHRVVRLEDGEECAAAIGWWEELTARGGEGMVVKPLDFVARGTHGVIQPAMKCRGREYLRLIYGPDYTEPANLERLRKRGLSAKRTLALREFALGVEALERFTRREPLWRTHQAVFAVLALESEPVDPRL
ncbi:MAG TPA: polynucleotide kinase-phosphatase [Ktedonobacterales bacterium]